MEMERATSWMESESAPLFDLAYFASRSRDGIGGNQDMPEINRITF